MKLRELTVLVLWLAMIGIGFFNCAPFLEELKSTTGNSVYVKYPPLKIAVAISLKQLVLSYSSNDTVNLIKSEITKLCGIDRIYGFIDDKHNDDIILIGARCERKSPILLEDYVELLRCAIDSSKIPECYAYPLPVGNKSNCRVKYDGVGKGSNIARVLLEACYCTKLIASGAYKPDYPYRESYMDLKSQLYCKQPSLSNDISYSKLWLSPGRNKILTNGNTVFIKKASFELSVAGSSGKVSPKAIFAQWFSMFYKEISFIEPVYSQLETMYRLYILQKILLNEGLYEKRSIGVYQLLENPSNNTYENPELHEGLFPFSGGTVFNPVIDKYSYKKDTSGLINNLEWIILDFKPDRKVISWIFPMTPEIFPYFN